MGVYQRNPLAAQLIKANETAAKLLEQNQGIRDRLLEARNEIRALRADKVRLQARIADLKKYRPQAPHTTEPIDEAEARLRAATNEVAEYHRRRRTARHGNEQRKAA